VGILFAGNTKGIIVQTTVCGNGDDFSRGAGIWVQRDAGLLDPIRIENSTITGNHFVGVGVTTNARAIIVQKTAISGTIAHMNVATPMGDGLGVFSDAHVQLSESQVFGNDRAGAIIDAAAAGCSILSNAFNGNLMPIVVQNQVVPPLLEGNVVDGKPLGPLFDPINVPLIPVDASNF
jgi:hypothetical protein